MPKPRHRRKSEYQTSMTKSVFLYGNPNKGKAELLRSAQDKAVDLINRNIRILSEREDLFLSLLKNDKKNSYVRRLEKEIREPGVKSAFSQNCFDEAFTKLSNRLLSIKGDMYALKQDIFSSSKVLFAMSLMGRSQRKMVSAMEEMIAGYKKPKAYHINTLEELKAMKPSDFCFRQEEFMDQFLMCSMEYKIPEVSSAYIPVDARIGSVVAPEQAKAPYVMTFSDPFIPKKMICVPVTGSSDGLRRLAQYKKASSFSIRLMDNGMLRVNVAFKKKLRAPKEKEVIGVDVGITDCLHTSNGQKFGSLEQPLSFYRTVVEPAFAYLSDLRNKKKKILHYVHTHDLPADVRKSCLDKVDRLEHMIREADAPYRNNRHYHQMVDHEIRKAVDAYIASIPEGTVTVLELLDIREFSKSRKVNGMFSTFARGKLSTKLMETLNWHGYGFIQAAPEYTSQVCPVCHHLSKENRNGKHFHCTCCGHKDDADHVGSINIRERVTDKEIMELCEENKYSRKKLQAELISLYAARNEAYRKKYMTPAEKQLQS